MSDTLSYTGRLSIETCWCGMVHGVPEALVNEQKRQHHDGRDPIGIHCPLGHVWVPAARPRHEIDAEKIKKLERERDAARCAAIEAAEERDAMRKANNALRQRAKGGACPCCKRTFVQLARHIKSQHPDFTP